MQGPGRGRPKLALHAFLWASFFWALGCYMFDIIPLRLDLEGFTGRQIAVILTLQAAGLGTLLPVITCIGL